MKTKTIGKEQDVYFDLVKAFPLRPLRDENQHTQAIAVLRELLTAKHLAQGGQDYADALILIVQEYEQKNHKIDRGNRTPIDILKYLMNERGMNVNDLGKIIGSQPTASLILNTKRQLSKSNIRKLADYFDVQAGLFL